MNSYLQKNPIGIEPWPNKPGILEYTTTNLPDWTVFYNIYYLCYMILMSEKMM